MPRVQKIRTFRTAAEAGLYQQGYRDGQDAKSVKHRHRWEPVAISVHAPPGMFAMAPQPTTAVLSRCGCGKVGAVSLSGRWSLEQVRGEAAAESIEP